MLQMKVPPMLLLVLCYTLVYLQSRQIYFSFTALLLISSSSALMLAATFQFKLNQTSPNPINTQRVSNIIQTGAFKLSRNPIYLGAFIFLLSSAFVFRTVFGFFVSVLFSLFLTQFQIKPEEAFLKGKFGKEYEDYCQRVRRWL
ncbi:isoprenylcysteine_carboxylmethyltransferase family protein [Hexamita inflata]|uniref:Isoprenylcysteine carboxylmethyltransferase family protein n=1 Tax=Hexamita inflata TaxID=28002 RepID=A0AA86TI74_9EUKA|nr:isoprenylcysteine carboxylmethyltransferase family protein [Hexamita inflata]